MNLENISASGFIPWCTVIHISELTITASIMLVEVKNLSGVIYFYFSSVKSNNDTAGDSQLLIFVLLFISSYAYSSFLLKEEYLMALC